MPVTINDIAQLASVSRATVSLVLRNEAEGRMRPETAMRVRQAMLDMNYRPSPAARRMRSRQPASRTRCLGYLFDVATRPDAHPYFTEVLAGCNEAAQKNNQHLLMGHGHASTTELKSQILTLTGDKVDGWLVGALHDPPLLEFLAKSKIPVVWVGSSMDAEGLIAQVRGDDFQGAYLGVQHLVELGHRRIACVAKSSQAGWTRQMLKGARQALHDAGIEDFVAPVWFHQDGVERIEAIVAQLFDVADKKLRPTAFFVRDDHVALQIVHHLARRGLSVPGDVSVVGHDGLAIGELSQPLLTTIKTPRREIGQAAIGRLLEIIEAPETAPALTILPVQLVERDLTAPVTNQD